MGMPACRITDQTAHGGIIILGFPQVLIGMMPASRIGDMHICPMVTVLVPHVGGPFILGSPTVLVGMMPQSRVTDQLVCVGPPDIAIKGEPTVLVGMAGAGGAAGAMGGVEAMGVPVAAAPAPPAAATQAEAQQDGTTKTSAQAGQALPPVALQQEGWPDLPPENTATFESVQPATVLPGTTLYTPCNDDPNGLNNYWSTSPPSPTNNDSVSGDPAAAADASTDSDWNSGSHVLVHTVPAGDGLKAWAGKGAGTSNAGMQVWTAPGSMAGSATQRFRMQGAQP